ncbi:MAG TPA: UDP-N-acetylmuramoyl-L-alanine--D-glutamate ligase [Gemmatimonadales bacterium]|nr:UDP-N-acetylmuramoyl-L-alanine--D-glutamate ligase [Gemmatimonadales bacterium]
MTRLAAWHERGGEVAVAGLGRSGVAAVRLLARHGIPVYASDRGATAAEATRTLAGPGVTIETGGHDLARIARSMALVLSPGIPPDAPVVVTARQAGVEVIAEAALGLEALPGVAWIGITGTNGKTTTTTLVGHLLERAGRRSVAAGNIGLPLSCVALEAEAPEWMAVELSSFQLHDMPVLRPAVGVLTNLSPDHLDRYPDLAAYYADKARLFEGAHAGSLWVHNLDDPESRTMVADVAGRHFAFSTRVRADAWFDRDGGVLRIGETPLIARNRLPLLGDHNVANALAAALAVTLTGVPVSVVGDGLTDVAALPHRMEPVATIDGVRYINDSKATNIASTRVALEAMVEPFVLLLGGRHKGEPYTALADVLGRARAVVTFGEAAPLVVDHLTGLVPITRVDSFEEAIEAARRLARAGDAVLLSPACSSYDMFDNYEQRGARFRTLVGGA